jgi:hypothetical protein
MTRTYSSPRDRRAGGRRDARLRPSVRAAALKGVQTHVVAATRDGKGWSGVPDANPGPAALGRMHEQELLQCDSDSRCDVAPRSG